MIQNMVTDAIREALHNMDRKYCELSQIDYKDIESPEKLEQSKYLERPFAYEFYHQLRTLIDRGEINFGGPIVQAEVDKDYQHLFQDGKIPDFIIHVPNAPIENLAIIEFKLANRATKDINDDLEKLESFKKSPLKYAYGVQVLIGSREELHRAKERLQPKLHSLTEKVVIIEFDTDSWKTN